MSAARVVRPEKPQKASSATVTVEVDHEERKEEEREEEEEEEEPFFIKEDNDEDDEDFCGGGAAVAEVDPESTARPRDIFSHGVQFYRYTLYCERSCVQTCRPVCVQWHWWFGAGFCSL